MKRMTARAGAASTTKSRRRGAGDEEQAGDDGHQDQRGAEVAAEQHQSDDDRRHREQRDQQVPVLVQQLALAGEQVSAPEHERELGRLGRLDPERPPTSIQFWLPLTLTPIPGTSTRTSSTTDDHQDRDRQTPEPHGREPTGHEQHRDAHGHPDRLTLGDRPRRAARGVRLDARRRQHHDQTETR